MADTTESQGRAGGISRKLLIPVAISAVGTLLGYLLSKKDRLPEAAVEASRDMCLTFLSRRLPAARAKSGTS